jgi:hypothetical protein
MTPMTSHGRLVAAQLTLAAVFGIALAWKSLQEREPHPAPASTQPMSSAAHSWRRMRGLRDLPRPIVVGAAAIAVAAVPVAVGLVLTFGGGRSVGKTAAPGAVASVAVPSAAPSTPAPGLDVQLQDVRRQLDLASVRDSLVAYATYFGGYPSTGGVLTTLCQQSTDAGCAVVKFSTALPVSDGTTPYWYASDGHSFTLLARVQTPPHVDYCPKGVPPALGAGPFYCIAGALSSR